MTSPAPPTEALDPIGLLFGASGPVFLILWSLMAAAAASWMIIFLKWRQLRRWEVAEASLRAAVGNRPDPVTLEAGAKAHPDALGADLVRTLLAITDTPDLLRPSCEDALTDLQIRAGRLMTFLSSVGAVAPFVGLLGTVYGIMDAFLRIGREKSASLPVVAPAIGEALIVTAVGLFAAIPAVIGYNFLMRRVDDLLARIRAQSTVWIQVLERPRKDG